MDQQALKEYFLDPTLEGKTYLFTGSTNVEELLPVAKEDLLIYKPQGKACLHPVEEMRSLKQEALRSPHNGSKKLIIVHDAEKMYPASSNALLKIFEEPPKHTFIFLLTNRPDKILPTILSRSIQIACSKQENHQPHQECIDLLKTLPYPTYFDLKKALDPIVKSIQSEKETPSVTIDKELPEYIKQRHEKVHEGENSQKYFQKVHELLETILYWYRDLEALSVNPYTKELLLPQIKEATYTALQQGKKRDLPLVSTLITKTQDDIQKGGSLQNCLESLFIQLIPFRAAL